MQDLAFKQSAPLTFGVELELQLVNTRDCDLTRGASDLLPLVERKPHPGEVKPEITESMIEICTSIHTRHREMLAELREIRGAVLAGADRLNVGVAGGGAHPFQHWSERQIYEGPRFKHLSDLYGYLAKQFTIFGQHVHIGCPSGDEALYLLHSMSRYVPHFIALSAASPYYQGVDTAFDSSRLNTVFAFPLSGRAPFVRRWEEFQAYFARMQGFGIVESMKDFYWDIRPKPEYGTVEIRVLDTPLTVERAAQLAAYAQTLAHYMLTLRPLPASADIYLVYRHNRFQACRYGFDAAYVDAYTQQQVPLQQDMLQALDTLAPHAAQIGTVAALDALRADITARRSDAAWLRETHGKLGSLNDVARAQSEQWMGRMQA